MPRFQVRVEDANNTLVPFELGLDPDGKPLWTSHLLEPVHISIYSQSEEARYANLLPGVGSVYAQDQLDGGMGKKVEVHREEPEFNRYYYGEWYDASVRGQEQKGPAVTTLATPTNSGPLSGFFVLAGVPYLVLSRRIASWAAGALTAVLDFGAGIAGAGAATYGKLGAPTVEATQTTTSTAGTLQSADDRLAQQIVPTGTGVYFLSDVTLFLDRVGLVGGSVQLSICADIDGTPSTIPITSASVLATDLSAGGAAAMSFRFDLDTTGTVGLVYNQPIWLVLQCPGATTSLTVSWISNGSGGGNQYYSTNGGNSWGSALAGPFYYVVNGKLATTTAFIGVSTGGQLYQTTTDGVTFTADASKLSQHFVIAGGFLVRSIQNGSASAATGTLDWSDDGTNWSQDIVVVGDPQVPITSLQALGNVLIVTKEDGIYAVDITSAPIVVEQLYIAARATTNGVGSTSWRGAVYMPFDGRLMAVEGDFVLNGFTVHESVGIEAMREWDWPWGQGRHVACVGTRFHLYSVVSTSGGYRLLKSGNPLRKDTANGLPDPEWHGSLATIGDGTQTITMMAHYDPGGSGSPMLFITTTANAIAQIKLPRSFNPAADPSYVYDTANQGQLFYPVANGNYPVHPKSWLVEHVTFARYTPSDYVEMLYDIYDGEGMRRMPRGARLYDTGAIQYPRNTTSRLIARQLVLVNSLSTASPLIYAGAVSYAMRHIPNTQMREISFTVVVEDGLSAADLGEMLGLGGGKQRGLLTDVAGSGMGTRRLEDPYGHLFGQVQFLDAVETLQQIGQTTSGRTLIQVSAVSIGP